jgi:hypothetical protein
MKTDQSLKTLRDFVLNDLARAQRLMLRVQDEIEPQYRISTPDGDYYVAPTLSDDLEKRIHEMDVLQWFMVWKCAIAFVVASQYAEPDMLCAIGVTNKQREGAMSLILRTPTLHFGDHIWLPRRKIGDDFINLLPRAQMTLTPAMFREVEATYGATGTFPAIRIHDGHMGL